MANNPYDQFDPDAEAEPLENPEPLSADRGEPTTRGPKKKKKGMILAVVIIIIGALIAVGFFGLFFYNAMVKNKASEADAVAADPALEQKSSTGPDLGAYQDRVAKQLEEDRKKQALEEARRRAAQNGDQGNGQQGTQGSTAAAPDLGKYQGQGQGGQGRSGGSGKKEEVQLTPQEVAAARRLDGDVMWDEKNATGGVGQQKAAQNNQGVDRFYSPATRAANSENGGRSNPSFEDRMAANPYLGGANGSAGSGGGLGGNSGGGSGGDGGSIGGMLATEDMPEGRAYIRPDLKFLLIHGTTASCVLLPRIVTNYPGQTRCMINRDVYSANGHTILIRSGSIANGERKVSMKQGVAKVFVAWRDVETPEGISIRLDSMAADQLGAAGLDAWVDNHYPERFGGAIMLSLLDDTFKALANSTSKSGDNSVSLDSSTSNGQDMASIALENSINQAPTGYVNQGTELTILVARDIDFRSIYGVE